MTSMLSRSCEPWSDSAAVIGQEVPVGTPSLCRRCGRARSVYNSAPDGYCHPCRHALDSLPEAELPSDVCPGCRGPKRPASTYCSDCRLAQLRERNRCPRCKGPKDRKAEICKTCRVQVGVRQGW